MDSNRRLAGWRCPTDEDSTRDTEHKPPKAELKDRGCSSSVGEIADNDKTRAQKSEKFDQLCAVAARELGYGELSALSVEDRIRVEDEAKQLAEQWEEMVEMKTIPTIRPITPLRHLLAEHHDACERILDEQEIEVGLLGLQGNDRRRLRRRQASF